MQPRATQASPLSRRGQRGFTLVEALVALIVLAVGLLGIAALYVESLSASRSALLRTHAVNLAADMADRIRANRTAGIAYDTASGNTGGAENTACETTAGCAAADLAAHDVFRWMARGNDLLPGFTAEIDFTDAVPDVYVITVSWTEPEGAATYALRIEA
ncbi:MAG TPA: type IV pilus modification protein PilV [Steroidobacteraceae bacterium]|nr:type IV pilus modification protein PilV [Steroidobacteraceae bacterium]